MNRNDLARSFKQLVQQRVKPLDVRVDHSRSLFLLNVYREGVEV